MKRRQRGQVRYVATRAWRSFCERECQSLRLPSGRVRALDKDNSEAVCAAGYGNSAWRTPVNGRHLTSTITIEGGTRREGIPGEIHHHIGYRWRHCEGPHGL